jgi:hypothetical protein
VYVCVYTVGVGRCRTKSACKVQMLILTVGGGAVQNLLVHVVYVCVCVYTVAKLIYYPNLLLYALFPQLKCWEEGGRSHSLLVHVVCVCTRSLN